MSTATTTALGTVCTVCNENRKRKGILYHPETFLPYCANPFDCNEDHPNSPDNVAKRAIEHGSVEAGKMNMLPFDEAEVQFQIWLETHHDAEEAERIRRMTTRPVTFRVGNYEIAEFLLKYQDAVGAKSVSDVVRYCIEQMMDDFKVGRREMPVKPIPPEEQEDEDFETRHEQSETTDTEDEWSF